MPKRAAEPPATPPIRVATMLAGVVAGTAAAIAVGTRVGVDRWKIVAPAPASGPAGPFDAQLALLAQGAHPAFVVTGVLVLAALLLGEYVRIRFVLYYMAVGGLAVCAAALLMGPERAGVASDRMIWWQVYATAGILGGAIYWLLAGRAACRFGSPEA